MHPGAEGLAMTMGRTPAWGALMNVSDWGRDPKLHFGATPETVARDCDGLVYLATPYSKLAVDKAGRWNRVESMMAAERAARHAVRLCALGVTAISPIVHAAALCHASNAIDPLDAMFWTRWCAPLLAASTAIVIPDIPGWDTSDGIWHEACAGVAMGLSVHVYARAEG
jgi:hypothetical protein